MEGKKEREEIEEIPFGLNMQILSDELEALGISHFFYRRDEGCLRGIRFFQKGEKLEEFYVYMVFSDSMQEDFRSCERISFLVLDDLPIERFSFTSSIIYVTGITEHLQFYNQIQQIFFKYEEWERRMCWAMRMENPLDQMLLICRDIFGNPLFIHDPDFYILSCPYHTGQMLQWEKAARNGREMVPLETINEFKVDEEYLQTLKTRSVSMFSASLRGYRVLYMNLFDGEHYEGRVCVDEVERGFRRSDYLLLEYVGKMVQACLKKQRLFWLNMGSDVEASFIRILKGEETDAQSISDLLGYLNWERNQHYLCLKLIAEGEEFQYMTPDGIFGHIETQITNGYAFFYEKSIAVVVNLTLEKAEISEILSRLAYFLREGLFKLGASSELFEFDQIREGYEQASVALQYGRRSKSMIWYYHFEDYAMAYMMEQASRNISPRLLVSGVLRTLKEYDEKNHTELYHTLELFLQLERNTVQTAKELFIHRSTLFYRLERIQKLTKLDLEDPGQRQYLLFSFELMREFSKS